LAVTAAAAGLSLAEAAGEGIYTHEATTYLAGSVSSAVVGYPTVRFLLHRRSSPFGVDYLLPRLIHAHEEVERLFSLSRRMRASVDVSVLLLILRLYLRG
jgi:hypothetical protein